MLPLGDFGIDNDGLNTAIKLLGVFLVVVWLALVYWTFADARRRISDPVLIGTATVASLIPFIGTIVYTILRPPEFLEDRHERELELRAAELRLRQLIEQSCPHCEQHVEKDFLRCPNCMRKLRTPARTAASRSIPSGRSARTARLRCPVTRRCRAAGAVASRPARSSRARRRRTRRRRLRDLWLPTQVHTPS
jgi:hypothetical protein